MRGFPAVKARKLLLALQRLGWSVKRQSGSHQTLKKDGWPDVVFAFHDGDEIGPKMLMRIAKTTGLTPKNLWAPQFDLPALFPYAAPITRRLNVFTPRHTWGSTYPQEVKRPTSGSEIRPRVRNAFLR